MLESPWASQRYQSKKVDEDRLLLGQMRRVVELHPRYGSERVYGLLNRGGVLGGWRMNYKRVHRLWKREYLQVHGKQWKKRRFIGSVESSCGRHRPQH